MSNEAHLSARIIEWINRQPRCRARKVHSSGSTGRGEPDILACIQGQMLVIETKLPKGGEPTSIQKYCLQQWRSAGAEAMSATSLRQVKDRVDLMLARYLRIEHYGGYE